MKFRPLMVSVLALLAVGGFAPAKLTPEQVKSLPPPAARRVDFAKDIKPIFEASCVKCHARGKAKGGFNLTSRATMLQPSDSGPAVVSGKSAESHLIELVSGLNPDDVMPQKGSRLTAGQVGLLRAWIDQGARWPAAISFVKPPPANLTPRRPDLPPAKRDVTHAVDRLLARYFKEHKITSPVLVDDRLFARRASLDLIGLLPSPAELEEFLQDRRPDKREALVAKLLADDRHYAEHWLTFWNDLLRNDYRGTGYIDEGRKPISRWLYSALATNMPFDCFVAELINPSTTNAEGFVKGIVWRGAINASQTPPMQAAQNISQVFLGVNVKCASCHDSFINDWTLADAYGLAAVYATNELELFRCDKPTGETAAARFLYPEVGAIDPAAPRAERMKQLARVMTSPKNGRLPRTIVNRLWARLLGRGLVEPLDDMERPAWHSDLLDWLAEDFVAHGHDLRHTLRLIATSRAYQLPAVNLGELAPTNFVFRGPAVRRLSAEQFRDALGTLTGVWFSKAQLPVATNEIRSSLVAADPLAVALGRPNREQVTTSRPSVATTLQALELTNGDTLSRLLARGAEKLLGPNPPPGAALVDRVFGQALGRPPTSGEQQLALALLGQPLQKEGVEDLLWAVTMLPEFQLIR
ncbi:MAG: PSD1 domain-containing protein [Verrucomicrobia bacterium]|nr:PSD1 domain-containing protein [Verrucomicrobiota bacterium]